LLCSAALALLVTLGLLYPVAAMIGHITREKQHGQKELMKMMSVTELDIGLSWFMTFFLFNIFSATIAAVGSMALYENSKGVYLWLFWIFTFLAVTVFSMFLSTLTSKSTRAVMIGLLFVFIGVFLTFAVDFQDGSSAVIGLISLNPVGAFSFGLQEIGRLEDQGVGLQSGTVGSTDSPSDFTFNTSIQYLSFDSIIWGVLTWYLNRVISPDYGQALHLWFPFTCSYWFPNTTQPAYTDTEGCEVEYNSSIPFEVVERRQCDEGKHIEIRSLRKVFGNTCAVDGLSLTMYSGQVTALLGHNGTI
jgi:ABC-type multidrug transport system permease subunit